jgi:hypothetical protein
MEDAMHLARIADYAHAAALDAELELDHDDAAMLREIEANARGLALMERARDYGIVPELAV